jgi:Na+/proline symporter
MSKFKTEIKWGVIFVIMSLGWMLLERLTGLHDEHIDKHFIYTNFIAIPAIAVYVFGLLDKRENDYNGVMNYSEGFLSGLLITLVVTLFVPVTQYITLNIITPDFFPNMIEYVTRNDIMTREAAENNFNAQIYMMQGLIGALLMGVLTSAVVAIFTRKS